MPTPREIGNRIYDQLSDAEKKHLADAMAAAATSGWRDATDIFYCNLGNAGVGVPVEADEKVAEHHLRDMCRVLEEARRSQLTDDVDWICIMENAFGYRNRERFVGLWAHAAEID